jgi:hypothetical protein
MKMSGGVSAQGRAGRTAALTRVPRRNISMSLRCARLSSRDSFSSRDETVATQLAVFAHTSAGVKGSMFLSVFLMFVPSLSW